MSSDLGIGAALDSILRRIDGASFGARDEGRMRDQIAARLMAAPEPCLVLREVVLGPRDRVDLAVEIEPARGPDGGIIAIECKVEGQTTSVYRQLLRYAGHQRVRAIVLASVSRRLIAALPDRIAETPFYKAHIRRFA